MLGKLALNSYSVFVEGLKDCTLLCSQRVFFSIKIQLKTLGVIYKLDVEKANNKENWDTVIYVLEWFGFGDKWNKRI